MLIFKNNIEIYPSTIIVKLDTILDKTKAEKTKWFSTPIKKGNVKTPKVSYCPILPGAPGINDNSPKRLLAIIKILKLMCMFNALKNKYICKFPSKKTIKLTKIDFQNIFKFFLIKIYDLKINSFFK